MVTCTLCKDEVEAGGAFTTWNEFVCGSCWDSGEAEQLHERDKEKYPIAEVIELHPFINNKKEVCVTVTVKCPLCGKKHTHGGRQKDAPFYGHRLTHCTDRSGGYFVVDYR